MFVNEAQSPLAPTRKRININVNCYIKITKGGDTMDIHLVWEKALGMLEKSMTQVVFDSIMKSITPISYGHGILTLKTNRDFYKPTIKARYLTEMKRCIRAITDEDIEILLESPEDHTKSITERVLKYNYEKTNLRQKYVFETFVRGKCNEFAYSAAQAVAESPGLSGYNPLFLYGGVGLGKTHLIHSIGNLALEIHPELNVMYVSSETFTNEFIASIRDKTTQSFKNKFRDCDVLLIDDVQFLVGKNETQEEMFHTFNDLYGANKQIVLASDVPPKELSELEARLTSRFSAGLIADITIPDYETRTAILEKKLDIEQITIPQQVKEFISLNIVSNIRDLEGALNKVTAYARLTDTPITLEMAQDALRDQITGKKSRVVTMEYIQEIVAQHFKISVEDLCSKRRTHAIVYPRQIAMYLCRKILDVSLPDVGKAFGGRDHSTVIHSCEKIFSEIEKDEKLKLLVASLEEVIKGK